jgi:quercetin dioxygenase-like cupin family protein
MLAMPLQAFAQGPAEASTATPMVVHAVKPAVQWGPCPPVFSQGCEIAVLRGNPAQPGADVWLRVPAGYRIAAHSHTSAERMTLVSGALKVRYAGQPSVVLQPGDYAYGPAKAPHVAVCSSRVPCVLFIAFEQPVDAMAFTGQLELQ